MLRITVCLTTCLVLGAADYASASKDFDSSLQSIMRDWASIKYETPKTKQADRFEALVQEVSTLRASHPDRAEAKIWEAIARASYAGSMGRIQSLFSALPEVTRARDLLLEAEAIDPTALDGSVYTTLGSLYYMVPGYPLGFGDKQLALEYLEKAVALSPDGIDANFFLGDYWLEQERYDLARRHLERALKASDRPQRPLADAGRRAEARDKLARIERKG